MDLENLKIRTQEIRSQFVGKRYVQWPKDFKKNVVAAIDSGLTTKSVAETLGISFPTVFSWRRKFSTVGKTNFKPVQIIEDKVVSEISLSWKQGLTVKGLCFAGFKELLKKRLLESGDVIFKRRTSFCLS